MKKNFIGAFTFIVLTIILLFPFHSVFAASNSLKNITTDKNGSVKIERVDSERIKYKITITPNKGYYIDEVRLYYDEKSYIIENIATFENGEKNSKIWYHYNQKYYDRQDIQVSFRKFDHVGTLKLTAVKENITYGEDIRIKLELKDKNGKKINISNSGILYLYAPLEFSYFSGTYSKETYGISRNNEINIDSTQLNDTKDLVFSGYYLDRNTGFITNTGEVKVSIDSIQSTIILKDSIQTEGNVSPVKAQTSNSKNLRVYYEVLRNNSYQWTREVPQWPGIYKMKAEYSGSDVTEAASEAVATLTVKESSSAAKYKTKEYLSSNNVDHYIHASINNKQLIIEGACPDTNFKGYSIDCFNKYSYVDFEGDRRTFNTVISLDTLQSGAYDITFSPVRMNREYNRTFTAAKLLLIIENDEIYFLQSKAYEINKNILDNINKADNNPYNLSNKKYSKIISKAKEITATTKDDYEKMKLIYTWVAETIYYDEDSGDDEQDPTTVFDTKKAICQGYTDLLHIMLQSVGIKDVVISGFANPSYDYYCGFDSDFGHAWNIAYSASKNRWVIMDSTWGSLNKYENGKFEYLPSTLTWFDCSLQALSTSHTSDHPKVAAIKPEFIASCTISVGDTISLVKNSIEQPDRVSISCYPSNLLRAGSNFNVKAMRAGVCEVEIKITTLNNKEYKKKIIITVKDPEIVKSLNNSTAISLNKNTKGSISSKKTEKYYSFKTNKDTKVYTIQLNNSSKKSDVTCIIYDKNGSEIGYFDCKASKNETFKISLKNSTTYYIKVYADEVSKNLEYSIKIKS